MGLAELAQVGEFVGGVAVLLSIIYLAIQVRVSARSARGAAHDSTQLAAIDLLKHIGADPERLQIFSSGILDLSNLSAMERMQFEYMIHALFFTYEVNFNQRQRKDIDDETWEPLRIRMLWYFVQPGVRQWWSERATPMSRKFEEFLEGESEAFGVTNDANNPDWVNTHDKPVGS